MRKRIRAEKLKEEKPQEEKTDSSQEQQDKITVGVLNQQQYLASMERRKMLEVLEQQIDLLKKIGLTLNKIGMLLEEEDAQNS